MAGQQTQNSQEAKEHWEDIQKQMPQEVSSAGDQDHPHGREQTSILSRGLVRIGKACSTGLVRIGKACSTAIESARKKFSGSQNTVDPKDDQHIKEPDDSDDTTSITEDQKTGDTTREKKSPKPVPVFLDPYRTPGDWVKKIQAPLQSLLEKYDLYFSFQDIDQNNPKKWLGIAHKSRFTRKDIEELKKCATETPIVIFHHEHTQLEIDNALYIKYSASGSQHFRLELMDSKKTSNDSFLENLRVPHVTT